MKRIIIAVPDGQSNLSTVASMVGTYEILSRANAYWKMEHGKEGYKIELAGISDQSEVNNGLFAVRPQVHISKISKADLIVIPSLVRDFYEALEGNKQLVNWIERQYKEGAEIASMCTGAFMLASAGLLDGKTCSTHWSAAETFKDHFPEVDLQPDQLITDENGIYTNGGAYSFLNLALYLVEKYFNRETAIYCSKIFQIDMARHSQSNFIIFKGQKRHGDEMIIEAQKYIESKVGEKISISKLASNFPVSRRQFDRRFKKATGNTPFAYMQRVKVEFAKKELETSRKTINEIMYEVSYSDKKAFRELFRGITGLSPVQYKEKYNRHRAISLN